MKSLNFSKQEVTPKFKNEYYCNAFTINSFKIKLKAWKTAVRKKINKEECIV